MKRIAAWSIRTQLIAIVLLMAAFMVGIIAITAVKQRRHDLREVQDIAARTARQVGSEVDIITAGGEILLTALSRTIAIPPAAPRAVNALLADIVDKYEQYANILLIDSAGLLRAAATPFKETVSYADRRFFVNAVATGRFSSGEFTIGRLLRRPVMAMGLPIRDDAGRSKGVMAVTIDFDYFKRLLAQQRLPANSTITVTDYKGIVVFDALNPRLIGTVDRPDLFKRMEEGTNEGGFRAIDNSGFDSLMAYRKLWLPVETKPYMYVRVAIPYRAALGQADRDLTTVLLLMLSLTLLAIGIAAYISNRYVVKKVEALKEASQRIAAGDLAARVSDKVVGGELGELGHTFDEMAQELADDIDRRKRSEEENAIIAEIGRTVGSTLNIDEVYERVASEVRRLIPCDRLMLTLKKPAGDEFVVAHVSGVDHAGRRVGDTYRTAGTSTGVVIASRAGVLIQPETAEEIERQYPNLSATFKAGLRSTLSVPLIARDEVIGALTFRAIELKAYREQDLRLAERIALQIAGAVANARLYAELKQAENALRESEERFRLAYATSPDAININRLEDGLYVDINEGFTRLTGYTREDVLGRRYLDIDIWCDPADRQELVRGLKEKGYYENLEADFRLKDGSFTTALMSAKIIILRGVPHILSITRDIGEWKRMQLKQRQLEERLHRAEKMEALGTLAGGVAHDLNNLLGVLVGYTELLQEKLPEAHPQRGYVEKILQSGLKSAAIIQDLLTLARRGVAVSEVVNLNDVVSEYLKSLEFEDLITRHPKVSFAADCARTLLNIQGSPVHLSKTVANLVSNAAEAIVDGGEVAIRTENRYLDTPVRGYDEMTEGEYAVLTVSDTGRGIPAVDLAKIFEPFYTSKVMGKSGTGLGLAVVWGTVKDHNGYIDIQSEEGKGSTFTLYFPVTRAPVAGAREATPTDEYAGRGESLLVVDDVEEQRELAVRMLTELGYRVDTVASGAEALEYLGQRRVDLIVLDMIMPPGIDGLETYRRIREISPGQKAVIVSGFSATVRVKMAQGMGAGPYVRKPYLREEIGVAIRTELDRAAASA